MNFKALLRGLTPPAVWKLGSRAYWFVVQSVYGDYSQAGETREVRRLLRIGHKHDGQFVEIGANDGVTVSTTLGLLRDGWSGLSVEPNPSVFKKLQRSLQRYQKVRLACVAVAPKPGPVKLFFAKNDPDGLMSTICTDDSDWFAAVRSEDYVEVPGIPLTQLLEDYEVPSSFDLLVIDAEGMDYEILLTLDFEKYRPRLIVTENYDPKDEQKAGLLNSVGYKKASEVGCNTFWLAERL